MYNVDHQAVTKAMEERNWELAVQVVSMATLIPTTLDGLMFAQIMRPRHCYEPSPLRRKKPKNSC